MFSSVYEHGQSFHNAIFANITPELFQKELKANNALLSALTISPLRNEILSTLRHNIFTVTHYPTDKFTHWSADPLKSYQNCDNNAIVLDICTKSFITEDFPCQGSSAGSLSS